MQSYKLTFGRTAMAAVLVFTLSGFSTLEALFAPKPDLWERWLTHDASSEVVVDHGDIDRFLKAYVSVDRRDLNRVDYVGVSDADRILLKKYIVALSSTAVGQLNRTEQMAFWINAYNALTLRVVLEHYPVASIRDIDLGEGFFADGPWDEKVINIENVELSLNDIEHRILRPIWNDPRIHYAVNCASIGCPNLAIDAYSSANLEEMLDQAAIRFVNAPRNIEFSSDEVTVSKIYSWFATDFGGDDVSILNHLRQYADDDLQDKLKSVNRIFDYTYDWSLNDGSR